MTSLKEAAKVYEPQQTKNIADLEEVSVEEEIKTEIRKDSQGKDYTISFIVINGEEYRVPSSVLGQLKTIVAEKPDMKKFKVVKKGEQLNTTYTVVQLD